MFLECQIEAIIDACTVLEHPIVSVLCIWTSHDFYNGLCLVQKEAFLMQDENYIYLGCIYNTEIILDQKGGSYG